MLELRQQLKTASMSNKGGEKESDRLKKELDKARFGICPVLDSFQLAPCHKSRLVLLASRLCA